MIAGDGIDHPGGYNSMLVNRVESTVRVILLYDIYIYIMYAIRTRSPDVRLSRRLLPTGLGRAIQLSVIQ